MGAPDFVCRGGKPVHINLYRVTVLKCKEEPRLLAFDSRSALPHHLIGDKVGANPSFSWKEDFVRLILRPVYVFVIAACVCQTLALNLLGHGQAAPPAGHLSHGVLPVVDIRSYNDFIQSVGKEDDRIQREEREGKTQTVDRTYYPAGIPLNTDAEQRMLSIVLDASKKEKEVDARLGCHLGEKRMDLASHYGDVQAAQMIRSGEETCLKAELPIAEEARLELKDELDAQSFRWLNNWVNNQRWGRLASMELIPNPCPPNYNPPPGQTTHLACGGFYEFFFEDFGNVEASNRVMDAEGKPGERERFRTRIRLPEDKRQAVIALGLEAFHEIKEIDEQFNPQPHGSISRNNEQPDAGSEQFLLPSEIQALEMKRAEIIEGNIFRLKQVLGDALFKQFDTELSAENLSIMRPVGTPAQPGAPAAK